MPLEMNGVKFKLKFVESGPNLKKCDVISFNQTQKVQVVLRQYRLEQTSSLVRDISVS